MNKTKILWWVIFLLAVLNVTMVFVIFHRGYQVRKHKACIVKNSDAQPMHERYFAGMLHFDDGQMDEFRKRNHVFGNEAKEIIDAIDAKKTALFVELQLAAPDTAKLLRYSEEIGNLHTDLKKATIRFYFSLQEICTPSQREKLGDAFKPLFRNTLPPRRAVPHKPAHRNKFYKK